MRILLVTMLLIYITACMVKKNKAYTGDNENQLEMGSIENYKVTTLKKDTLQLINNSYTKTFIVFANNYSCLQCFNSINSWAEKNNMDTTEINAVVVGRVGNETLSKRSLMNIVSPLMPLVKKYYFDIQKEKDSYPPSNVKDGLFGKYKIDRTPAILIWDNKNKKELLMLHYKQLVDNDGLIRKDASSKMIGAISITD